MEQNKEQLIIHQVLQEAWANPVFKAHLIANPIPAIRQLTGIDIYLPPGKRLAVYDQSDTGIICLNIPPNPQRIESGSAAPYSTQYMDTIIRQLKQQKPPTAN